MKGFGRRVSKLGRLAVAPVALFILLFGGSVLPAHATGVGSDNYTGVAYSYTGQTASNMEGITFSTDGTNMYLTSYSSAQVIYQYTLSTAWNISTATYVRSYNLANTGDDAVRFSTDGTRMFIDEFYNQTIREYTLSTAWNISTATVTTSKYLSNANYYTFTMKSDGTALYAFDSYTNKIFQYTLSTPWDLTTISASPTSTYSMTDSYYMFGAAFSSDGSKLYINRTTNSSYYDGTIRQYNLSTPWLISTASSTGPTNDLSTAQQDKNIWGVEINPANSDLYAVGTSVGKRNVYWYSPSAPDISPPTATVTVPSAGALVSGSSVTLTATSTDNQGVAGVTFYENGVKVGNEITSSPYTTTWDSTTATSTSVAITAVARDTSNNYGTSTPVTVTVSNGTPTVAASNVSMSNISGGSATLNWTNGNGGGRVIFINATSTAGSPSPVNNTTYTASSTLGIGSQIGTSGWYAVYASTTSATSTVLYGLSSSATYQIQVVEYNGQAGSEMYYTTAGTGNPYTKTPYAGNTIYANYTSGNDTTGAGTSGNPYKTFTKAYSTAIDGDTLNLTGTFTWTNSDETGDVATNGFNIAKSISIAGQGAGTTTIQASTAYGIGSAERVFTLAASTTLSVQGVTMRYGYNNGSGGGCLYANSGDVLTLTKTDLSYCDANNAPGAGIYSSANSTTTIDHSSVRNNYAVSYGGGIYAVGSLIAKDSTFTGNSTYTGTAYGAAAASIAGSAWFINSTITGNTGYFGALLTQNGGNAYLINTIVASNTATQAANADIYRNGGSLGTFTSLGNNIIGRNVASTGIASTTGDWNDPVGSGTFTRYGGGTGSLVLSASSTDSTYGTTVIYPQSTSIALNNATTSTSITAGGLTLSIPTTDQVYAARYGLPDIGASEFQGNAIVAPPVLSSITASSVGSSTATITWTTNESANATINYGTTTAYGTATSSAAFITSQSFLLTGLSPATTYHYQVASADSSGNTASSSDLTFMTATSTPTVTVQSATTTPRTAILNGTLTATGGAAPTIEGFKYGLTTSYGSTASSTGSFSTGTFAQTVTGLTPSTTYHYQAYAVNTAGTASSSDATFTTNALPVITVTASTTSSTTFGIAFGVNVLASSTFSYGTTTAYATTLVDTAMPSHAYSITGLTPSTVYHFMIGAIDAYGDTATTSDATFMTNALAVPTIASIASTTNATSTAITFTTNVPTNVAFRFGTTTAYATTLVDSATASHTFSVSNLVPSSTYHFQIIATDSSTGAVATSSDYTVTTIADTVPPVLQSPAIGTLPNGVSLSWPTDVNTTAYVGYGTTTSYGMSSSSPSLALGHAIYIYGLTPSTLYHFIYSGTDIYGNTSTSSDMTFTTSAAPSITPTVTSMTPGLNSVQVVWTTPANASSQILFGPTTSYGSSTPEIDTSTRVLSHTSSINGLLSCTLYHYEVTGANVYGNRAMSTDATFITTGCTGGAAINSSQQGTIPVSTGGTVANGAFTLSVPVGFTVATTSAIFEVHDIDRTGFFATAGTPAGKQAATSDVYTTVSLATPTIRLSAFASPLTITLSYTSPQISGLDPSSLWIYRYDSGVWTALDACVVNAGASTVTCHTSNFSDFALFGTALSGTPTVTTGTTGGSIYGGTSVRQQVQNLLAMGSTVRALQLEAQWPQLFGAVSTQVASSTSSSAALSSNSSSTLANPTLTHDLQLGVTNADVLFLQRFLNAHGFVIATSGAGSPGNETTYFGKATRAALIAYQKAHGISPASGYFGSLTRAYIAAH